MTSVADPKHIPRAQANRHHRCIPQRPCSQRTTHNRDRGKRAQHEHHRLEIALEALLIRRLRESHANEHEEYTRANAATCTVTTA